MKLIVKLVSIFFIFIGPIAIIAHRYQTETKTVEVESSIGIVPTIFIIVIAIVLMWFAFQQFMNMVKHDKFGTLSIMFFGIVLAGGLFIAWFSINNIVMTAQNNLENFVESFSYHKDTLYYMIGSIIIGISILAVHRLLKIKTAP